jgi:hypothetical protein
VRHDDAFAFAPDAPHRLGDERDAGLADALPLSRAETDLMRDHEQAHAVAEVAQIDRLDRSSGRPAISPTLRPIASWASHTGQ